MLQCGKRQKKHISIENKLKQRRGSNRYSFPVQLWVVLAWRKVLMQIKQGIWLLTISTWTKGLRNTFLETYLNKTICEKVAKKSMKRQSVLNHEFNCSIFKTDFLQLILNQTCCTFSAVLSSTATVIQVQNYTAINELVLKIDFAKQNFL